MKNPCPHKNVQQYTECCFDCGRNIYETDEEYTKFKMEEMLQKQQKEDEELAKVKDQNAKLEEEGKRLNAELAKSKSATEKARQELQAMIDASKKKKAEANQKKFEASRNPVADTKPKTKEEVHKKIEAMIDASRKRKK